MALSKRIRFEIFRRDGFKCRYCGLAGPEGAGLTIDHVVPVALGGSGDPSNLVAACKDCNAGKSSSSPDSPLVAQVSGDALRWAAAMKQASSQLVADVSHKAAYRARFLEAWESWDKELRYLDSDWIASMGQFQRAGLPIEVLVEDVEIAWGSRASAYKTFRYMCGIAWNQIADLQKRATVIASAEPDEDEDAEPMRSFTDYIHAHLHIGGDDPQDMAVRAAARAVYEAAVTYHQALVTRVDYDFATEATESFFKRPAPDEEAA